jgi:hypothetical protein
LNADGIANFLTPDKRHAERRAHPIRTLTLRARKRRFHTSQPHARDSGHMRDSVFHRIFERNVRQKHDPLGTAVGDRHPSPSCAPHLPQTRRYATIVDVSFNITKGQGCPSPQHPMRSGLSAIRTARDHRGYFRLTASLLAASQIRFRHNRLVYVSSVLFTNTRQPVGALFEHNVADFV